MDKEQYLTKKKSIQADFDSEMLGINSAYAFSNSPVEVGDIVTGHYQTIKVDKIKLSAGRGELPQCVYFGAVLTKKGEPRKDGERNQVWQCDLIAETA